MPSFTKTLGTVAAALAAVASALPSQPKLTPAQRDLHNLMKRQNAAAAAAGLTDVDILQFALTLEWLEASFYQQGFALFAEQDFISLGLTELQVTDLLTVGNSEQVHVTLLQSTIAQLDVQPVQPCTYNFGLTTASAMVATAAVLENVGVSAYLGAVPLVSSSTVLDVAASIVTVESRHQTFVRAVSGVAAAPGVFDTALSPRQIFTLAAPFIQSCPSGSNLALTAFPPLTMSSITNATATPLSSAAGNVVSTTGAMAGATLMLSSPAAAQAQFCGFTNGGQTGGTAFAPFTAAAGCVVPQNLEGIVYVTLTSQGPLTGALTDDIIVAGPMVFQAS